MKHELQERRPDAGPRFGLLLVSSGLALAGAGAARAETPPPSRDQVLLVSEEADPIPESAPTACAAPAPVLAKEGEAKIAVIEVADGPALAAAVRAEVARHVGSSASEAGLAAVTTRIDCLYKEAGYAYARSKLEPTSDDPQHPGYRLTVDEGRLGRIEAVGGSSAERDFAMRAFSAVAAGKPIRFADIRRGLSLARFYNVWGIEPEARCDPHDPDHVVLVLKLPKPRPMVYVSVQNLSRASVGRWSASGQVTYHLPTPFYDEASVALFTGLHDLRQVGGEISESVLLGKGFGLHAAASVFQERPTELAPSTPYVGTTSLGLVEATQLLPLTGEQMVRWRAGVEATDQTVKQKTGLTTERDHLRVAYASLRFDGHAGSVLGWGEITVRQGLDGAGASRPGGLQLSRPNADPQATDLRFTSRIERAFKNGRMLSLETRGQWTDKPLLLFEQFTYGGMVGGRGLDPDALMGDRGLSTRLEWDDRPLSVHGDAMTATPIAYVESAWTKNVAPDPAGFSSGRALFAGAGARLSWKRGMNLDLTYATPLEPTHGVAPGLSGPRMIATLSAGF